MFREQEKEKCKSDVFFNGEECRPKFKKSMTKRPEIFTFPFDFISWEYLIMHTIKRKQTTVCLCERETESETETERERA